MKFFAFVATLVAAPMAFAGSSLTCTGSRVLYVESLGDSGVAVPRKGAAVFFKDQLLERRRAGFGEASQWQTVSVEVKEVAKLLNHVKTSEKDTNVTVRRATITVKKLNGEPLLEGEEAEVTDSVVCSEVNWFKPVP